jgi:hypothetical protein
MKQTYLFIVALFLAGLLAACGALELSIEPTARSSSGVMATPDALATQAAELAATQSSALATLSVESTRALSTIAAMTPQPPGEQVNVTPPAEAEPTAATGSGGLVYWTGNEVRITTDFQQEALLVQIPYAAWMSISPDGRELLYSDYDDFFVVDVATGEERNITAGSQRIPRWGQWWPARPGAIVFGSFGLELEPSYGFLTLVNSDGSGYRVLDSEVMSFSEPGLSPDGKTIAYDRAGEAWLYHLDLDVRERFNPALFGLPEVVRLAGAAWSPDGRELAWIAALQGEKYPGDPWQIGVVVFDLESRTGRVLHPYHNVGRGGWFEPPVWSPDGRWLTFRAEDRDREREGLWAVAVDGVGERFLGPGRYLAWRPDSRYLAYTGHTAEGLDDLVYLVDIDDWSQRQLELPAGSRVLGWFE